VELNVELLMKKIILMISIILFSIFFLGCKKVEYSLIYLSPGDTYGNVRSKLYLMTEVNDLIITWTSSDESVIDTTGNVFRPSVGGIPITVDLKAEFGKTTSHYQLTVQPLTGNSIYDLYPGLNDEQHIIEEISYAFLIELLENKQEALIYLGFENCPWCKEYLPIFHQMAKNTGNEKIYYYNFLEIRKVVDGNLYQDFQKIIDLIDTSYLVKNPTNDTLWWLYAPTFIGLKDGEVKGLFTGAIPNHIARQNQLTVQQLEDLKVIFRDILYGVKPFDPSCLC
jgi:predicted bacteriocin transport accessory protein